MHLELIAFDLNGTLLDMSGLDAEFTRVFSSASVRGIWFEQLKSLWLASNAGEYQPFDQLAEQALEQIAADKGQALAARDKAAILDRMLKLPPFPDVREGLTQLRKRGKPLVALTNGTLSAARAQLDHAGIKHLFDAVFSADEVERFKPAPEAYLQVVTKLDVAPADAMLVSAHDWDLAGARALGMQTTFVFRPGSPPRPASAPPQRDVSGLPALAELLDGKKD